MTGHIWLVVGPSGAGKDTVLAALCDRLHPDDGVMIARRTVTRPNRPDDTERHVAVSDQAFDRLKAAGAFALTWDSHGLRYGIGADVRTWLIAGMTIVANGSRAALPQAREAFGPALRVVEITAPETLLAARLVARGREAPSDIADRLARNATLPQLAADLTIENVTTPEAAAETLRASLLKVQDPCV